MFTFHDFLNMRNAINRTDFSQFLGKHVSKPKWLVNASKDKLHLVYNQFENFYNNGEIYLSCILRANTLLFRQVNGDTPAQMIYTNDEFFYENPAELLKIVDNIYDLRKNNPYGEDVQDLLDILYDDYCRPFNFKLPLCITNNKDVWLTSVIMIREHIPFHKVSNFFYPLMVLKDSTPDAMVLPKWYWSENFRLVYNFTYDNKVRSNTYEDIPINAISFFEPFISLAFFREHPAIYILFVILEILSFITPLKMYMSISNIFNLNDFSNSIVLIGLTGTFLISCGFINIIWSFMDKYLGNKVTIRCFIIGITLIILSFVIMSLKLI